MDLNNCENQTLGRHRKTGKDTGRVQAGEKDGLNWARAEEMGRDCHFLAVLSKWSQWSLLKT